MSTGTIKKVAGPLVIAEGMRDANMFDVVRVSSQRLIGEIIEMHGDEASVQVYEETSGLGPGAESQAHAPNEITWKQDLVTCAALYAAVPGLYKTEEKTEDATEFRQSLTDNDIQ